MVTEPVVSSERLLPASIVRRSLKEVCAFPSNYRARVELPILPAFLARDAPIDRQ